MMVVSRPKFILAAMVVLAVILAVVLFVHPGGEGNPPANPAPHAPDQTPR
jgi:hypothetical protein